MTQLWHKERIYIMTYDEIKYYIDNFCKVLNISDYIGIIAYGSYVKKQIPPYPI